MLVARGKLENRQAIVEIGFQAFALELTSVEPSSSAKAIQIQGYGALVDTGAQRTCLSRTVISNENLKKHGKRFIQNVHSDAVHYLYWANLGFWANGTADDMRETRTYFALPTATEVIDIAPNTKFDPIIGMDVLQRFDFRFERSGDFEIRLV